MSTSASSGDGSGVAERMGLKAGMVVMEVGYDDDVDQALRDSVVDCTGEELVDADSDEVVDVVLLWHRDDDGDDLTDLLVDSISPLAEGGTIWLLTPKRGRAGSVDASDISEAAAVAGLSETSIITVAEWSGNRLVGRKSGGKR